MKDRFKGEVELSELLLGFSSAALHYLGLGHQSSTSKTEVNLDLARYNIGVLELLKEKCNGQMTDEESKLVHDLLHDLRVKYIEVTR